MTDFAFDGPIFLVPLSLSYPSSPELDGQCSILKCSPCCFLLCNFHDVLQMKNMSHLILFLYFPLSFNFYSIANPKRHGPRKGNTLWCAIGIGTSLGTLSWWAPCLLYERRGMCGSVYGYPASKISLGPFWI